MKINCERSALGIELGSTVIKSVLTDESGTVRAKGSYRWESEYKDGRWTYSVNEVKKGLRACYADLIKDVQTKYGETPERFGCIGISAMMHGYIAVDKEDNLLTPFRTWRNVKQGEASKKLSELFKVNVPERFTVSHLYQAILNKEEHVKRIDKLFTLSSYTHYLLTGEYAAGYNDASGMFPLDVKTGKYAADMAEKFDAILEENGINKKTEEIFPKPMKAGEVCGELTEKGARLLDESGRLKAGIKMCPPEGDAGTGLVSTNTVTAGTGNVSAGTSIFASFVLKKPLREKTPDIDEMVTPNGYPLAMIHCNNCSSEINEWVGLFKELLNKFGVNPADEKLFGTLFNETEKAKGKAEDIIAYNYTAGEHITKVKEGKPLIYRNPQGKLTLGDFMRATIYSCVATLAVGMKGLKGKTDEEITEVVGHGGFFKTPKIAQEVMSSALETAVSVYENAGEGGAYGMALLALYAVCHTDGSSLEEFIKEIFKDRKKSTVKATDSEKEKFERFLAEYEKGLKLFAV